MGKTEINLYKPRLDDGDGRAREVGVHERVPRRHVVALQVAI
jgi:hypothetical protein